MKVLCAGSGLKANDDSQDHRDENEYGNAFRHFGLSHREAAVVGAKGRAVKPGQKG